MTLMVLDTSYLYFRAFFGVPDTVRAPDGTPVNAVHGLLETITRLVTEHRPGRDSDEGEGTLPRPRLAASAGETAA